MKIVISYNSDESQAPRTVVLLETWDETDISKKDNKPEHTILWSSSEYVKVDIDVEGL